LLRVHRVAMGGASSSIAPSSRVENSAMVVGGRDRGGGRGRDCDSGEAVDVETRIHVIALIVAG